MELQLIEQGLSEKGKRKNFYLYILFPDHVATFTFE